MKKEKKPTIEELEAILDDSRKHAEILPDGTVRVIDDVRELRDLCEAAWGIIANVNGGDISNQTIEWQGSVNSWRNRYHDILKIIPEDGKQVTDQQKGDKA